jgi:hypothetical protein
MACVRKKSKENIRNLHLTMMISLVPHSFDVTRCHDAMPQSIRWRQKLGGGSLAAAVAAWRQPGGQRDGSAVAAACKINQ